MVVVVCCVVFVAVAGCGCLLSFVVALGRCSWLPVVCDVSLSVSVVVVVCCC